MIEAFTLCVLVENTCHCISLTKLTVAIYQVAVEIEAKTRLYKAQHKLLQTYVLETQGV